MCVPVTSVDFLQCCKRLHSHKNIADLLNRFTNGHYDKGIDNLHFYTKTSNIVIERLQLM